MILVARDRTTWALLKDSDIACELRNLGWTRVFVTSVFLESSAISLKTQVKRLLASLKLWRSKH